MRHRLQSNNSEVLFLWHQKAHRTNQSLSYFVIRCRKYPFNRRSRHLLKSCNLIIFRARKYLERTLKLIASKNCEIESLVRYDTAETNKIISSFLLCSFCFVLLKEWINNGTFTIIIFFDSLLRISRISNKNIRSLSCFFIPFFHQRESRRNHKFCEPI